MDIIFATSDRFGKRSNTLSFLITYISFDGMNSKDIFMLCQSVINKKEIISMKQKLVLSNLKVQLESMITSSKNLNIPITLQNI
jgi:hypothetical protein